MAINCLKCRVAECIITTVNTSAKDAKNHYRQINRILIWVLVLNWLVALAKIIYGLKSRLSSMTADGFHSLSDGTSNVIGIIGIHFACQPKDKDHPYGHKKYETFYSLAIAALLLFICFNIFQEGIRRIYKPVTPQIDIASFLIMIITLAINIAVMNYEYRQGRRLASDILVSDSLHTRADIFTSLSVIATLIAVKLGFPLVDPVATLLISVFIAYAALTIIRQSSRVLCDTVAADVKRITDIVLSIRGVKTCHKIRSRGRGDDIYLDLHVQVDPDMHVGEAHRISYAIEEAIKKGIPEVADVLVHIEPKEKGKKG